MTPTTTTPLSRKRSTRFLDHIEIHQDAIHVTQHNVHALAIGLDSNLGEKLNSRRALEEIDVKSVQRTMTSEQKTSWTTYSMSEECKKGDSLASSASTSQHQDRLPTTTTFTASSPLANHKIRLDNNESTNNTIHQNCPVDLVESNTSMEDHEDMASTALRKSSADTISERLAAMKIVDYEQGQGEEGTNTTLTTNLSTPKSASRMLVSMESPLARRSVSNKENVQPFTPLGRSTSAYDVLEEAVVQAATPPSSQSRPHSSEYSENPQLETSQQATTPVLPHSEPQSPGIDSHKRNDSATEIEDVQCPTSQQEEVKLSPKIKKTPLLPRINKAVEARILLAHGPKDAPRTPAWGPPRFSTSGSITSGLRHSVNLTPRNVSGASTSSGTSDAEKKEVVIPHSKPRPMSMAFPAPPPLMKSTKPPTRSTFQLPGEAVAAKLKAARQEREKKEDTKPFKARPVPATIKDAPIVRQTNTSRARESLGGNVFRPVDHNRANSVASFRPEDKQNNRPASRAMLLNVGRKDERPGSSLANISRARVPTAAAPAKPTTKREVFTRDVWSTESAERTKREHEEATRKARADAAERSRQLSREWAEKKRREQLKGITDVKVEVTPC